MLGLKRDERVLRPFFASWDYKALLFRILQLLIPTLNLFISIIAPATERVVFAGRRVVGEACRDDPPSM
jgi:hypothetical protein